MFKPYQFPNYTLNFKCLKLSENNFKHFGDAVDNELYISSNFPKTLYFDYTDYAKCMFIPDIKDAIFNYEYYHRLEQGIPSIIYEHNKPKYLISQLFYDYLMITSRSVYEHIFKECVDILLSRNNDSSFIRNHFLFHINNNTKLKVVLADNLASAFVVDDTKIRPLVGYRLIKSNYMTQIENIVLNYK